MSGTMLVREAMRLVGVPREVDIVTLADVPSRGAGLGSSSAVTVGLLNALYAFPGVYEPVLELAEEAARIELDVIGTPIGRQDQYAAAIGGFNFAKFLPRGGGVRVEPIVCRPETLRQIQRSLLLFYTGRRRDAVDVLREQRSAVRNGRAVQSLKRMRDVAWELRERIGAGDADVCPVLLRENGELKRAPWSTASATLQSNAGTSWR